MASTSLHESMHGQGVVNYIAGMLTRMADGLWCMRMVKEWPRRARKCARAERESKLTHVGMPVTLQLSSKSRSSGNTFKPGSRVASKASR